MKEKGFTMNIGPTSGIGQGQYFSAGMPGMDEPESGGLQGMDLQQLYQLLMQILQMLGMSSPGGSGGGSDGGSSGGDMPSFDSCDQARGPGDELDEKHGKKAGSKDKEEKKEKKEHDHGRGDAKPHGPSPSNSKSSDDGTAVKESNGGAGVENGKSGDDGAKTGDAGKSKGTGKDDDTQAKQADAKPKQEDPGKEPEPDIQDHANKPWKAPVKGGPISDVNNDGKVDDVNENGIPDTAERKYTPPNADGTAPTKPTDGGPPPPQPGEDKTAWAKAQTDDDLRIVVKDTDESDYDPNTRVAAFKELGNRLRKNDPEIDALMTKFEQGTITPQDQIVLDKKLGVNQY